MSYNTTSYESFYGGSPSALSPEYGDFGSVGYRMDASGLGFPGSPQTANQLGETVNALKQGVKAFEVSLLGMQGDVDQAIPKEHFKEMRALMKLSGVKPSVHGPLIDAAGFSDKGWGGEHTREDNARRMFDAVEKAHMLDPTGNTPVVFHSSNGTPGRDYVRDEDGKIKEYALPVIDKETHQVSQLKEHRTYYLSTKPEDFELGETDIEKGGSLMTARESIENRNATDWEEKLKGVVADKVKVDRALQNALGHAEQLELVSGNVKELPPEKQIVLENEFHKAQVLLDNSNLSFRSLFDRAYKYGSEDQQKVLHDLAMSWQKDVKQLKADNPYQEAISRSGLQDKYFNEFMRITKTGGAPKVFEEVEDFSRDKAAETFGEIASKSYDKFGDNAPIIAVENMYQGMAFSRAEDLKDVVDKSRKNFQNFLVNEKGLDKDEAKKVAAKHIGVTWDVGHLNMMKKKGFTDKDILAETKTIAPLVKHVHLTDNFGYADSHLAPGMGNVPFKDILSELKAAHGSKKFKEMRKIVEAGGFVQHFKASPHPHTLSAFGSPLYGMNNAPYWNQGAAAMGGYFGGYGTLNPAQHHSIYGAGFTTMPVELGGQMPGTNSRFGGAPMA